MPADRDRTAIALVGAAVAGIIAVLRPELIPALTLALAAWVALALYLKL
ncbi:hypothetical protein ACFTUC_38755 [Streptomyces sp. NPDC056944]